MKRKADTPDQAQIRALLDEWAAATRQDRKDDVLANHAADVLIYDVLPPMKYEGAAAYRRSWAEWQPETKGEVKFGFEDLAITTGSDVAFATCFIRCGGTKPNGQTFEDLVRATICLQKLDGAWKVKHQHISMPLPPHGG
ncbi:MAG: nuclear transport factor 2 family protein [Chloroflexi bacterium]|nr:nuclear transport factor 2 family protein [Chloroflexota bacterium]